MPQGYFLKMGEIDKARAFENLVNAVGVLLSKES